MQSKNISAWLKVHRRSVMAITAMSLLALILFRSLMTENPILYATNIIDALVAAIIVAGTIAIFQWYTAPPPEAGTEPLIIPARRISDITRSEANTAGSWLFVGHTARFVRSQVIPSIARRAIESNSNKRIRLIIINPNNLELCRKYAEYRRKVKSSNFNNDFRNAKDVRNQVLATVVHCIHELKRRAYLNIDIAFRDHLSVLRYDMTENLCLVTNEDPSEDGILFLKNSQFYKQWALELQQEWDEAIHPYIKLSNIKGPDELSIESIGDWLEEIGLITKDMDNEDILTIFSIVNNRKDPYSR